MKQTATVIAVDREKGTVTLQITRSSACEGCHAQCDGVSCTASLVKTPPIRLTLSDPIGKQVGEQAVIVTRSGKVIAICAVIYLLPAILSLAALIAVQGHMPSAAAYAVFFAVLTVAFLAAVRVCDRICKTYIRYQIVA